MRLLIVGTLKGQLTTATKLAMEKGASVTHADQIEQALAVLRSGRGADLIMADVALDIRDLVLRLGPGAVLELDRKVGEAIDIYVNDRLVARGEVVLVEEKLGVTMTEIIKAERS